MVSYATLEDAMVACDANPECSGVYDGDCNGDDYYMCDKDGAYESSSSSCVHVKAKAPSTPTTASPTTASPTAEPALGRRALVWSRRSAALQNMVFVYFRRFFKVFLIKLFGAVACFSVFGA